MQLRPWIITACGLAALAGCSGIDATGPADAGPPDARAPDDARPDAVPLPDFDLLFVDPDHGSFAGTTQVLVRGVGFDATTEVRFGGRSVQPADLQLIDSRRVLVRTPPGEPGLADVEVEKNGAVATLAQGFRYEPVAIEPPSGSVAGGTFVTITGFGTDFGPNTTVTFDNRPLTDVQVLNDQVLRGITPPGTAGTANVVVTTSSNVFEADRAYTYESTGDPFFGGMSGGPIAGTVNVVVIDNNTENGVAGAYVVIGDPLTSPLQGTTDNLGQITFSDPGLVGPITVTAGAAGYELASFVGFDASNLSIFLRQPPPPFPGPPPPAPQAGRIFGHVLFGDAVAVGSPYWDLVPEPRTATEKKRVYVTTTASNMFGQPLPPTAFIDYEFDPNVVAWEFNAWVRPSATAVVAIAGLYDPALDPSGSGATGFEPFAMGVSRGILVGPGEEVMGVDIVVDTPLDSALNVRLDSPPALDTPGFPGPSYYRIRPFIDLGGEGAIQMNKHGMRRPPPPEEIPNTFRFAPGSDRILLTSMAALAFHVSDSSYGLLVGAYTETDASPYSARVVRGIRDMSSLITVGDFIGTPRGVDPADGGVASDMALSFINEAPATQTATFNLHMIVTEDNTQIARILTRGDILDVALPDLSVAGLPTVPTGVPLNWQMWSIKTTGNTTFDQFTYRQLSTLHWDAYATSSIWVQFPDLAP